MKARNNPTKEHHHPLYHPLAILPNSAIRQETYRRNGVMSSS
jgi:hypothetical protein